MKHIDEFIQNPRKAFFTLAGPTTVAMVVQTLYNAVDTVYVGRLGAIPLAALTFSFPLFFILTAIGAGIGAGMASKISRFMGAKKKEEAENAAMHGIYLSLVVMVIIIALGQVTLEPLLRIFGAEGMVLKYAEDYMRIILYGLFFMIATLLINSIFSSQGDTKTSMIIQLAGLLMNVILDPVFIFALGWGVTGAAVATVISFIIAVMLGLFYIRKHSFLHIHAKNFKFSAGMLKDIVGVGFPATLMMLLISVYVILLNRILVTFGNNYVAAFGVIAKIDSVAVLPVVGFSMSAMTLVGIFIGAKRFDLVREISSYSIKIGVIITSAAGIIIFIFAPFIIKIFTPDEAIISVAVPFIRIELLTYPLMVISMTTSRIMQGMGYGFPSLMINLVRIFIFAVPAAYIFVYFGFGFLSVAVSMVIGGIASSVYGLIITYKKIKLLEKTIS